MHRRAGNRRLETLNHPHLSAACCSAHIIVSPQTPHERGGNTLRTVVA